jgi:hypothetical protein
VGLLWDIPKGRTSPGADVNCLRPGRQDAAVFNARPHMNPVERTASGHGYSIGPHLMHDHRGSPGGGPRGLRRTA